MLSSLRPCLQGLSFSVGFQAASSFKGHSVFGIRSLAVRAPRLRAVVEDCGLAAKSADARDKYFETYVSSASAADSKALRSELPSLEAGRNRSLWENTLCLHRRLQEHLLPRWLLSWPRPCPKSTLARAPQASQRQASLSAGATQV